MDVRINLSPRSDADPDAPAAVPARRRVSAKRVGSMVGTAALLVGAGAGLDELVRFGVRHRHLPNASAPRPVPATPDQRMAPAVPVASAPAALRPPSTRVRVDHGQDSTVLTEAHFIENPEQSVSVVLSDRPGICETLTAAYQSQNYTAVQEALGADPVVTFRLARNSAQQVGLPLQAGDYLAPEHPEEDDPPAGNSAYDGAAAGLAFNGHDRIDLDVLTVHLDRADLLGADAELLGNLTAGNAQDAAMHVHGPFRAKRCIALEDGVSAAQAEADAVAAAPAPEGRRRV